METIEEYETEVMATPLRGEVATRFTVAEIKRIQAEAFAAGKAQGRLEGLREARQSFSGWVLASDCFDKIGDLCDRLEREQQTK